MVTEQVLEAGNLHGELSVAAEAEEDDPGVGLAMAKNQLAEIAVVGDEHASFGMGKG